MAQRTKQAGLTMSTSLDGRLRDYCKKHHLGRTEALAQFLDNAEKTDVLTDCLASVRDTMERNIKALDVFVHEKAKEENVTNNVISAEEQLKELRLGKCPRCGSGVTKTSGTYGYYLKCYDCGYTAGVRDGVPYVNKDYLNGVKHK